MFNIQNSRIITIVKGDTVEFPLFINANTDMNPIGFTFGPYDEIYFSVMEPNQKFNCGVIRHTYDINDLNESGDIVIKLTSEDTINLYSGTYYYEIKLVVRRFEEVDGEMTLIDEHIDTVVPKSKFIILD